MSADMGTDEVAKLREQIRQLEAEKAQKDATINKLHDVIREKSDTDLNVSEHIFTVHLDCPEDKDQVSTGKIEKSEEVELEGVRTEILATVALNSRGEHQVEVWSVLSCDDSYNLTLFTELQVATKTDGAYGKPISFGLQSDMVRVVSGRPLQCTKSIVPEWQQKYAVACRGQTIQLTYRVKIARSFKPLPVEDEECGEEVEIGGKKIRANLAYLSSWSAEFRNGLQSRSRMINEVSEQDFEEMLEVILPSSKPITVWNVEKMLNVAHKLKMSELTRKCEVFLNENDKHNFSEIQILILSDKYSLQSIKTIVLERISSTEMLRSKVINTDDYNQLKPEMKKTVDSRYVQLDLQAQSVVGV